MWLLVTSCLATILSRNECVSACFPLWLRIITVHLIIVINVQEIEKETVCSYVKKLITISLVIEKSKFIGMKKGKSRVSAIFRKRKFIYFFFFFYICILVFRTRMLKLNFVQIFSLRYSVNSPIIIISLRCDFYATFIWQWNLDKDPFRLLNIITNTGIFYCKIFVNVWNSLVVIN